MAFDPPFLSLARLWSPFGFLWTALGPPWDALGCIGGRLVCLGTFGGFFDKLGRPISSKWLSSTMPAYKKRPAGTHLRNPGFPGSGARAAAPNPTSLAPGARMTVVKHTPSNDFNMFETWHIICAFCALLVSHDLHMLNTYVISSF